MEILISVIKDTVPELGITLMGMCAFGLIGFVVSLLKASFIYQQRKLQKQTIKKCIAGVIKKRVGRNW